MAETIKVQVTLEFEVEKSAVTQTPEATAEFVKESLGEIVRHYGKLTTDSTYLGPEVKVVVPQNAVKAVVVAE
jgi:hypothetical protein